jgi:hypothetical protein
MPTRFMLLYGMDDAKLQCEDDHPDRFEGEEHKVNIANLRKGLRLLGYEVAESGPYDDELMKAHWRFLAANTQTPDAAAEEPYVVKEIDDLGTIAQTFGIVSWKYLYEVNKDAIGDNPDLLEPGVELTIPAWNTTSGDEKIEAKGAKAFAYTGGMGYRYVWVAFSMSLTDEFDQVVPEFDEERDFVVRNRTSGEIVYAGTTTGGTSVGLLLPDGDGFEFGIADTTLLVDEEEHTYTPKSEGGE